MGGRRGQGTPIARETRLYGGKINRWSRPARRFSRQSRSTTRLNRSKKDVVDPAVREYIENHRDEINAHVREALAQLDGTKGSVVSMLTGFDAAKPAELGGIVE
jgi:hypothetical protein